MSAASVQSAHNHRPVPFNIQFTKTTCCCFPINPREYRVIFKGRTLTDETIDSCVRKYICCCCEAAQIRRQTEGIEYFERYLIHLYGQLAGKIAPFMKVKLAVVRDNPGYLRRDEADTLEQDAELIQSREGDLLRALRHLRYYYLFNACEVSHQVEAPKNDPSQEDDYPRILRAMGGISVQRGNKTIPFSTEILRQGIEELNFANSDAIHKETLVKKVVRAVFYAPKLQNTLPSSDIRAILIVCLKHMHLALRLPPFYQSLQMPQIAELADDPLSRVDGKTLFAFYTAFQKTHSRFYSQRHLQRKSGVSPLNLDKPLAKSHSEPARKPPAESSSSDDQCDLILPSPPRRENLNPGFGMGPDPVSPPGTVESPEQREPPPPKQRAPSPSAHGATRLASEDPGINGNSAAASTVNSPVSDRALPSPETGSGQISSGAASSAQSTRTL